MATRIFLIASIFVSLASATLDPYIPWDDYFDHGTMLRPANDYRLYWTIHEETEMVEIGLQVETTGWVGFGISNDGMMPGADMIIGWVPDDTSQESYLQRRHSVSTAQRYPVFDEDISKDLEASWQEDGVTFLHFTRELFPCADEDDPFLKQIIMGTTFVLFAYNDIDPDCSSNAECDLIEHNMQSMGSQSINFFSGESTVVEMPDEYQEFSFLMDNYEVPAEDTTYYCKFIELEPFIANTSHMIRFDPIIQPGNEAAVHHIILYWCQDMDEPFVGEADCNDHANMPELRCTSDINLAVWAVGGSDFYFPEHVGYPIQGKMYMLLEIHYDNPNLIEGIVDSSGIKIYWTEELREFDASQFRIAAPYDATWIPGDIPDDTHVMQSFHSAPECSANTIPESGVNMIVGFLHAHTIGVAMKVRHIRNNVELQPLLQNDQYDFNYQQWITFSNEVELLPGDEFICECNYSSSSRVYPTYGGQSTQDEMCVCTVYYYPAVPDWDTSVSIFSAEQYADFFQTAIDNGWWNGTTDWSTNEANQQSERYYYNGKDPDALQHYLDFQATPNRQVFCNGISNTDYIIPDAREDFQPLPPDDFGDCDAEEETGDESGLSDEEIIIIASVAGGVVVLLIAILACYICKRKRKEKWMKSYENMDETDKKTEGQAYGATTQ